ncbi:very long chain fatty acid elongase AAEL008004-like [Cloeon dipterum]|uniref:Elongation of very long chain fatty acids protein n=1 Tax=Cloeon dipterum TaxID=197152 RepID=A0A8S1D2V8_9INSE|nr:Hypothetical predicted protein [Cloeon dipterum]
MSNYAQLVENFQSFLDEKADPRTREWFLVDSPGVLFTILASYLYFCNIAGPRMMKNKKPFQLKGVLIAYNAFQVVFSAYIAWEGLQGGWLHHYSFKCQPVDYSHDPVALRMARACWCYFFCKIIELLDTIFFVLRKKDRQVSFLHLYHHTIMPFCAWVGTRYLPGGHGTLLGVINSVVHIVMYSYYLLAAFGPEVQKYLWWKKYITTMQLVQFCIVFVHCAQLLVYECNYPKSIIVALCANAIIFFYMFADFFKKNYGEKKKKTA